MFGRYRGPYGAHWRIIMAGGLAVALAGIVVGILLQRQDWRGGGGTVVAIVSGMFAFLFAIYLVLERR